MIRALLLAIVIVLLAPAIPARAQCQQHCIRDCSSGRCCTRCVTRCYRPPSYSPAPNYYQQPRYQEPHQYAGPDIAPLIAGLGLIAVVIAVIAGIVAAATSSNVDTVVNDTALHRDHARDLHTATEDTRAAIASVDAAIDHELEAARERGRSRADATCHDLHGDYHV